MHQFIEISWKFYKSSRESEFLRRKWREPTLFLQILTLHRDQSLSSVEKAFIEHAHSLFLRCHVAVARHLFGIQLVSVLKDDGVKERKRANSDPKTSDAVVTGRTNDHRVRETRKNKVLKTKDNRWWFAPPFHPLYSVASISLPVYLSVSRDADVAERREHFSLFCRARAISLALFFPDSVAFLMSYLSQLALRNTHCRFCSNRAPVIYDDPCLRPAFVSRYFRPDNARFCREMLFEIIALFRISAWSAVVFSTEKNSACSDLWQR